MRSRPILDLPLPPPRFFLSRTSPISRGWRREVCNSQPSSRRILSWSCEWLPAYYCVIFLFVFLSALALPPSYLPSSPLRIVPNFRDPDALRTFLHPFPHPLLPRHTTHLPPSRVLNSKIKRASLSPVATPPRRTRRISQPQRRTLRAHHFATRKPPTRDSRLAICGLRSAIFAPAPTVLLFFLSCCYCRYCR